VHLADPMPTVVVLSIHQRHMTPFHLTPRNTSRNCTVQRLPSLPHDGRRSGVLKVVPLAELQAHEMWVPVEMAALMVISSEETLVVLVSVAVGGVGSDPIQVEARGIEVLPNGSGVGSLVSSSIGLSNQIATNLHLKNCKNCSKRRKGRREVRNGGRRNRHKGLGEFIPKQVKKRLVSKKTETETEGNRGLKILELNFK